MARKPSASKQGVLSELSPDPPESFRIQPGRVSGGDLRGLMYGLLEAAAQIRTRGHLVATVARPALPLRSLRLTIAPNDRSQWWYRSDTYWSEQFETLARARFNRLTLFFEGPRSSSLLEGVPAISRFAAEFAMDLAIAFRLEDLASSGEAASETAGPSALLAIKGTLTASPSVRTVQFWVSGQAGREQAAFCEEWLFRAVREAGRRIALELVGPSLTPELVAAAQRAGLPFRVGASASAAPPKPPAGVRPADVFWLVHLSESPPAAARQSLGTIRQLVLDCLKAGCTGFEIAPRRGSPDPQLGSFAPWGRLGYDPKTADSMLKPEALGL